MILKEFNSLFLTNCQNAQKQLDSHRYYIHVWFFLIKIQKNNQQQFTFQEKDKRIRSTNAFMCFSGIQRFRLNSHNCSNNNWTWKIIIIYNNYIIDDRLKLLTIGWKNNWISSKKSIECWSKKNWILFEKIISIQIKKHSSKKTMKCYINAIQWNNL